MSGGPTLTSREKAPTPPSRAAKPAGGGLSAGKAAIKKSLHGKGFDEQTALLSPDKRDKGPKPGRAGARGTGRGAAGGSRGGYLGPGKSGDALPVVGSATEVGPVAETGPGAAEADAKAGPASDVKALPFFAGRGGGPGGAKDDEKQDKSTDPTALAPAEKAATTEQTGANGKKVKYPKMEALVQAVEDMGGPRYFVNGPLIVPIDPKYNAMSHADFEVYAKDKMKGNDRSDETPLQAAINDFCFEAVISYFPHWVMTNCYIFEDKRLRQLYDHAPYRLHKTIEQIKHGSPPPTGNWAAFAEAGRKAKEKFEPMETAFLWAMFISAGCNLAFGAAVGSTFQALQGGFGLAWAGAPRKENGLKDELSRLWTPPPLTLQTVSPLQRKVITTYYFNDNALVHRFFNEVDPSVPHVMREKLAASMMAIS